jgi:hypothetical protein
MLQDAQIYCYLVVLIVLAMVHESMVMFSTSSLNMTWTRRYQVQLDRRTPVAVSLQQ